MMSRTTNPIRMMRCWGLAGLYSLALMLVQPGAAIAASAVQTSSRASPQRSASQAETGVSKGASGNKVTEVEGISVHGTDEYPKVFNIVPWQTPTLTLRARPKLKADMPGLLTPVDPRVLERQRKFRNSLHLVNPQQGIQ